MKIYTAKAVNAIKWANRVKTDLLCWLMYACVFVSRHGIVSVSMRIGWKMNYLKIQLNYLLNIWVGNMWACELTTRYEQSSFIWSIDWLNGHTSKWLIYTRSYLIRIANIETRRLKLPMNHIFSLFWTHREGGEKKQNRIESKRNESNQAKPCLSIWIQTHTCVLAHLPSQNSQFDCMPISICVTSLFANVSHGKWLHRQQQLINWRLCPIYQAICENAYHTARAKTIFLPIKCYNEAYWLIHACIFCSYTLSEASEWASERGRINEKITFFLLIIYAVSNNQYIKHVSTCLDDHETTENFKWTE